MTIRVLIVDDSPFVRDVLRSLLESYADIEVIGEASDGRRAEEMAMRLDPDVITMDLLMPMMDGVEAVRRIIEKCPIPILIVADVVGDAAVAALEAGACDVFPKPHGGFTEAAADELVELIRSAAKVDRDELSRPPIRLTLNAALTERLRRARYIGLVASTGGPRLVRDVIVGLPADLNATVLVVQHTSVGCTDALVSWFRRDAAIEVRLAREGETLAPSRVYVAPDDQHLEVMGSRIVLSRGARVAGHRPSGTVLLRAMAREFGDQVVAIVLTGMGRDGAEGAALVEKAGGLVVVQEPATATIDGMPRQTLRETRAALLALPEQIARIAALVGGR